MSKYTEKQKLEVVALRKDETPIRKIAKLTGIPLGTIARKHKIWAEEQADANVTNVTHIASAVDDVDDEQAHNADVGLHSEPKQPAVTTHESNKDVTQANLVRNKSSRKRISHPLEAGYIHTYKRIRNLESNVFKAVTYDGMIDVNIHRLSRHMIHCKSDDGSDINHMKQRVLMLFRECDIGILKSRCKRRKSVKELGLTDEAGLSEQFDAMTLPESKRCKIVLRDGLVCECKILDIDDYRLLVAIKSTSEDRNILALIYKHGIYAVEKV